MRIHVSTVLYKHTLSDIDPLLWSISNLARVSSLFIQLSVYDASPFPHQSLHSAIQILSSPRISYRYHAGPNIGFSRANNFNLLSPEGADFDLFLICNPDISFEPVELLPLLNWTLSCSNVSCSVPLILNSEGYIQYSAKKNPTLLSLFLGRFSALRLLPFLDSYYKDSTFSYRDYLTDSFVCEYVSGCFMVVPPHCYRQVSGFSPEYFLHMEDADISRKLCTLGDVVHNPLGLVTHRWARGSHSSFRQTVHLIFSLIIYFRKWGLKIL